MTRCQMWGIFWVDTHRAIIYTQKPEFRRSAYGRVFRTFIQCARGQHADKKHINGLYEWEQ